MNSYMKKALHEYNMSVPAHRPYYRPEQFHQLPASMQSRIECRAEELEKADRRPVLVHSRPAHRGDRCRCHILLDKKHCAEHGTWPHGGTIRPVSPRIQLPVVIGAYQTANGIRVIERYLQ